MGIFNSITGPTLPVLAQHVCKSPTTVSWIFSGRSVGFLIGSGSGLCFNKSLSVENVSRTGWPSGLRRWIKAPISSEAWVRIPLQSNLFQNSLLHFQNFFNLFHFFNSKKSASSQLVNLPVRARLLPMRSIRIILQRRALRLHRILPWRLCSYLRSSSIQ